MHESGYGVTRDLKSAFQYYRKGAKLDHVESLVKCGDFLYSGRGLPSFNSNKSASITARKDPAEAFKCYKKASDMNSARGMNNCGLLLEQGYEGQPPDPEKAEQMYRQAHKLGNLDATINLAFHFLNDTLPSTHQALARLGFENGRAISKALLKYAYRRGKVDALDFLC